MKPKVIKGRELLKQLAESSGYLQYEIVDILNTLAICIAENASLGYSTSVAGLGTFKVKQGYSIKGKSNLTGEEYNTLTDKTLSFKVDGMMRSTLNQGIDKRDMLNNGESNAHG